MWSVDLDQELGHSLHYMQGWQRAQVLQKKREAEAAAQRAERARLAAMTAASQRTAEADALTELALAAGATSQHVRAAYKRLALLHHPDKHRPDDAASALNRFLKITAAYHLLKPC